MKKYHDCPIRDLECPYYNRKKGKCAMAAMSGEGPLGQCDEYDFYNADDEYENEEGD